MWLFRLVPVNFEDNLIGQGVSAIGAPPLLYMKLAETFRYSPKDFLNCVFKKNQRPVTNPVSLSWWSWYFRVIKRDYPEGNF